jgi:hypothetical protein
MEGINNLSSGVKHEARGYRMVEYKSFLAISSGKGWLDGWRMIAGDDT